MLSGIGMRYPPPLVHEIDAVGHAVLRDAHLAPPVYAACRDALARPGHLFSPSPIWARLFLAWIDALAPERRDALLAVAVACECMAAGYDLIDAVSDHVDATGTDTALNHDLPIGVTLLLLAQETLAALDPPGARAAALLARAGRGALAGQMQDQELRRQPTASQDAALDVLRRRSGTLVAAPCQCAAVLAGARCTRRRRIDPSAPIWLDPSFSSSSFLACALISGRC